MHFVKMGFACLALTASTCSMAGEVEGTHVVWFNLSSDTTVDNRIREYLTKRSDPECWEPGSLLMMKNKPASLTASLVTGAVLHRDKQAIKQLDKLLKTPYGRADTGFDGIIVYTDSPKPRLYSMALRPVDIKHENVDVQKDPEELETLFCKLLPLPTRPS